MSCLDTLSSDCSNCTNSGSECVKCINGKFLSADTLDCVSECEETSCGNSDTYTCISNEGKI